MAISQATRDAFLQYHQSSRLLFDALSRADSNVLIAQNPNPEILGDRKLVEHYSALQKLYATAAQGLEGKHLKSLEQENQLFVNIFESGTATHPVPKSATSSPAQPPSSITSYTYEVTRNDATATKKLGEMLAKPKGTYPLNQIGKVFRLLHPLTRRLAFKLLCKLHEHPYSSKEAIRYFVLNPSELFCEVIHGGKKRTILAHLDNAIESGHTNAFNKEASMQSLPKTAVRIISDINNNPKAMNKFVAKFLVDFNEMLAKHTSASIGDATQKQLQDCVTMYVEERLSEFETNFFAPTIGEEPSINLQKSFKPYMVIGDYIKKLLCEFNFYKTELDEITIKSVQLASLANESPESLNHYRHNFRQAISELMLEFLVDFRKGFSGYYYYPVAATTRPSLDAAVEKYIEACLAKLPNTFNMKAAPGEIERRIMNLLTDYFSS